MMAPYLLLLGAVVSEVFADSMMKLSNGFARKMPVVGVAVGYLIAFYLLSLAMQLLPLGLVYAVWTGLGVLLTVVVGTVFWHERMTWRTVVGSLAIVTGVAILEMAVRP